MSRQIVLLVRSKYIGWRAIENTLQELAGVRILEAAGSSVEALRLAALHQPNVIFVAEAIADGPTLPLLGPLRQACPRSRLILVAHEPDTFDLRLLVDLGIADCLLWSDLMSEEQLTASLQVLLARRVVLCSERVIGALLAQRYEVVGRPAVPDQSAPTATAADRYRLTPRESDVLNLLCQGYSNGRIAQALIIGKHTVETHLRNIFQKLGVGSRGEAAQKVAEEAGGESRLASTSR